MQRALREMCRRTSRAIPSLFFWALFFLFGCLYLDPKLIHYSLFPYWRLPPYVPGVDTFGILPDFPGKAITRLAAFLLHAYSDSWAGALIITATAWLLCWGAGQFISVMSGGRLRILRFIPAIVVLLQYSRCDHYLMENLSIASALLLLFCYTRAPIQRRAYRIIIFLSLSVVIYYAAVFAYLLFVALFVIYEALRRRDWINSVAQLAAGLLIPAAAGVLIFDLAFIEAYRCVLPYNPTIANTHTIVLSIIGYDGLVLYLFLYAYLPLAGLSGALWRINRDKTKPQPEDEEDADQNPTDTSQPWLMLIAPLLLIIVFGGALFATDQTERKRLRISYYAQHEMWPELLHEARDVASKDVDASYCHNVDRALHHSGRLLDDMFAFPQKAGWELYDTDMTPSPYRPLGKIERNTELSECYYELGRVNDAEHCALDALSALQYNPRGIMRLALINIVKKRPDAARTFLRTLRKDRLYRDEAQALLDQLEQDPDFTTDQQIQQTRALLLDDDSIGECSLEALLQKNKHNRMAFEYLMAHYLLTNQTDAIARNIRRLADFDYPAIPRALEEALVIHAFKTNSKPVVQGYTISQESIAQFQACNEIFARNGYNPQAAYHEFAEKFGDSYFFYSIYGISGVKQ
ncbi:hypothetical protein JXA32_07485 [Candidatus Sumerlaeota bacterium]|nr:hypothetical protein [Candidatus Sumerlaeota bacterium]